MSNQAKRYEESPFEVTEENWFATQRTTRPSQRPTEPPPAVAATIDDSIADGWFVDV